MCTGDRNEINDSLESLPSGHSTAAWAGLLFLSLVRPLLRFAAFPTVTLRRLTSRLPALPSLSIHADALDDLQYLNGKLKLFADYRPQVSSTRPSQAESSLD